MDNIQIDLLTVLVAALLNVMIGFFWYSKWLFGPVLTQLNHEKSEKKHSKLSILYGFIVSLVIAYFLAFFETYMGITTVTDGMFIGFAVWLGFVATTQISSVIWKDVPFKVFLLNTSYKLLSLLVMSGVIGA